jgi:pteridine reductase
MTKNLGTALVTGSAKRIGREIVIDLARKGYDVVIAYNESKVAAQKLAAEVSKNFQVKAEIYSCDLRDIEQAKKMAQFMVNNFKNWNLLINNASIFSKSKFISGSEKDLMDNLNIHLISPLILSKEFAKIAPQDSQIINMIDKNIVRHDTSYFYYLLSKKSLAESTKMMALELSPKIRVNGIAPGFILNSIDGETSEMDQKIIKKIPLERKGDPKDICQAVQFLLENKFINGQIIFVDGGASLNHAG